LAKCCSSLSTTAWMSGIRCIILTMHTLAVLQPLLVADRRDRDARRSQGDQNDWH
jgi:hypothetical protein